MAQAGDPGFIMAHHIEPRSTLIVILVSRSEVDERNLMMEK
jgi:hypothetical protein